MGTTIHGVSGYSLWEAQLCPLKVVVVLAITNACDAMLFGSVILEDEIR